MRIIIADDQPSVRSALRLLLEQDPAARISEAVNADDLSAQVEAHSPDIILLDWELPGGAGELISKLHARCRSLYLVVLSSRPHTRQAALASGADAFVCEGDPPEELLRTLQRYRKS